MRISLTLWMALVAVFFSLIPASVHAYTPRVGVDANAPGTVTINGKAALRFRASNGSLSADERARITAERLTNLVASGMSPSSVYLKSEKWQARVMVGETLVCIATATDAKVGGTTPAGLAGAWVRNIRSLLAMPAIVLSDKEILVPLGENRRVYVAGAATGPVSATPLDGEVAAAAPGTDARYVQVTGRKVGQTTVEITVEGEKAILDVWVKKYAGAMPGKGVAEVTGSPCPKHLLEYAARQAVARQTVVEPGATLKIGKIEGVDRALESGVSREAKANVTISGEGYITYSGPVSVELRNIFARRDEVAELFYSNAPERVPRYQTLFAGKLESGRASRLLYHHQNGIGKRARFLVEVINPNPTSAAFRVTRGISSPMIDTVLVGYIAGIAFMRDDQANATVIERIPAQSRLILVSDDLGHNETSSGIMQIKQTEGSGTFLRVSALPPETESARTGDVLPAPTSVALDISDQVYPNPVKTLEANYRVGEHWAFISVGRHAITDTAAQKKLFGNYGVTYDISIKVENPTDKTKKVSVLFEPSAGLASGVFIIDGEIVSTKYAKPPTEYQLASYSLKPGEKRSVRIQTVPLSGSNYPATLVVRS